MSQVTITLNGRTYRLACGEGEEARLLQLADMVRAKLADLIAQFGQAGDDRLLLMTALLIADELLDARTRLSAGAPPDYSSGANPTNTSPHPDDSPDLPAHARGTRSAPRRSQT